MSNANSCGARDTVAAIELVLLMPGAGGARRIAAKHHQHQAFLSAAYCRQDAGIPTRYLLLSLYTKMYSN